MSDDIISTTLFNLIRKSAVSKNILVFLITIAFSQMRDALNYSHIASEVISAPVIVVYLHLSVSKQVWLICYAAILTTATAGVKLITLAFIFCVSFNTVFACSLT